MTPRALGLPDARIAVFTHPLGGLSDGQVVQRAAAMMDGLMAALAKQPKPPEAPPAPSAAQVAAPADPSALQAWTFERGWSDGLPVIAPTRAAVARMPVINLAARCGLPRSSLRRTLAAAQTEPWQSI